MIFNRLNAIQSLYPEKNLSYNSGNNTCTLNGEKVTEYASIDAEIKRLQAEYDAQAYARKRAEAYPSVQECVHAILDDTLDALQAKRALVKLKYPKGG